MKKIAVGGDLLGKLLGRVPRTAIIAGAIALVAVIAFLALAPGQFDDRTESRQSEWNSDFQPRATEIANAVIAALEPHNQALDAIANDPKVREALRSEDRDAALELAAELTPAAPDVQLLRLLPADVREAESTAEPPLTFASMSMLRRARQDGAVPPAEVHLAGREHEHLVMLRRVVDDSPASDPPVLLGFAHLSVDPNVVRKVLSENPPAGVFAEIKQGIKVRIASSGTKSAAGAPSTTVRVPGTALAIKLTAPGVPAGGTEGGGYSMIVPVVAAVIVIGGVFLFLTQRPGVRVPKSSADSVIYQGAIRAILDGAHPGLEQLLPGGREQRTNFDIGALEERAQGDDITKFNTPPGGAADDPTVPHADLDSELPGIEVSEPVPASIFRSYDIRGIVDDTLTEDGVYLIGRALGAEAEARGQKAVVVARDGRHSSEALLQALAKGLLESGRDVLDIGLAPTPVLYFATHYLDAHSGVMITGSHNPAQYNGLKIVLDGETLSGESIQAIRRRVDEQDFVEGTGSMEQTDIIAEYIRRISEDIPVTLGNALKVVVDCGNGVPGMVAPDILRAIGHDVIELYCDVDGDFPNHHPDPSQPENLAALIEMVADEGADLGLAFDGDGDRLGVVDGDGNVIWPDRQMILFARDVLSRNPGAKIIYDVKCSRMLGVEIKASGGEPIMYRTGHSLIKSKMAESGALLAGEMSGHIFFKERWYGFDDALYSAARLMEILTNSQDSPADVFAALPGGVVTPELRLDMPEEEHAAFMDKVLAAAAFDDAEVSAIDGLRVDFPDSWGLIRASNTTPCLVLRFEGDDAAALAEVQERFRTLLAGIDPSLDLPF